MRAGGQGDTAHCCTKIFYSSGCDEESKQKNSSSCARSDSHLLLGGSSRNITVMAFSKETTAPSSVLQDADLWKEQQRMFNFLHHYDLHKYYERLVKMGVTRLTHFKDVTDADLVALGFSPPEKTRLWKKLDNNFSMKGKIMVSQLSAWLSLGLGTLTYCVTGLDALTLHAVFASPMNGLKIRVARLCGSGTAIRRVLPSPGGLRWNPSYHAL